MDPTIDGRGGPNGPDAAPAQTRTRDRRSLPPTTAFVLRHRSRLAFASATTQASAATRVGRALRWELVIGDERESGCRACETSIHGQFETAAASSHPRASAFVFSARSELTTAEATSRGSGNADA